MLDSVKNKRPKKQNTKTGQIVKDIRQQIVNGILRPGDKLPTYDTYGKKYQVSKMTMQMAFTQLKTDGFVKSVARQGLFVSKKPPHANRFALLLPVHEEHNRFWRILIDEAMRYTERIGYELEIFHEVNKPSEHSRLLSEISHRRFAGLILVCDPRDFNIDDIMVDGSIPKACFHYVSYESTLCFSFDSPELIRKSLDYFAAANRKKIAYITCYGFSDSYEAFLSGIKERGMESCEAWQFPLENPDVADNLIQLLMSLPKDRRPDALLLADDNVEEAAHRGLIKSGIKIPDDLEVICYCNWNCNHKKLFPLHYVGFNIEAAIAESINFFTRFENNPVPSENCMLPALFEDELNI